MGWDLQEMLLRVMPLALRIGGVMSFAPFIGGVSVTLRIKAVLTILLTVLLYGASPATVNVATIGGWTKLAFGELTLGLGIGLCLQFVFEGAQVAGQLAGFQFSFSLVNVIDPQSEVETPVLATFHQLVALLLFLQMNVHHWILRGLQKSFEYVPPGTIVISLVSMKALLRAAGAMWLVGVQMAAPVLLATMVVDVTVGFLSKASPQMPAIYLSIPMKILAGYAVLAIGVGLWPGFFEKQFTHALAWSERMLHLAH